MKRHSRIGAAIALGGSIALGVGMFAALQTTAYSQPAPESAVLTGSCLNPTVRLTVEEQRLSAALADNSNPAVLQNQSFALQMINGAGFQDFGPQMVAQLCAARSFARAQSLAVARGKSLWKMAVERAQDKGTVSGSLPYSDDRPLYWTNLQAEAAIQQWMPSFVLTDQQRTALITSFDRAARGMFSIQFPAGQQVRRLIMSGFDPYTLDGGQAGTAPGAVGNNIRHGNPSGATALAMDDTVYRPRSGTPVYIQAYLLPVDFPQFKSGYLEDTVGPWMQPGPRQVNASVTVSQAGPYQFNIEQWNARYHGTSLGNDNFAPCPQVNGTPELAVNNPECNSQVVPKWGGPTTFSLRNPPQWTTTTLPVQQMIAANTGHDVPRPPGDGWPDTSAAFGVVWHTNYTEFPNCRSTVTLTRNSPVPTTYPPPSQPIPPDRNSCSYSGGGGNYLSNESAYRNTLLRDRMGLDIPAGHIHTPDMQHFDSGNLYNPSDNTFNAWRLAIVHQGEELVHVVAANAPDERAGTRRWPDRRR